MDRIRTASGRQYRRPGLIEQPATQIPDLLAPALSQGVTVLGDDGKVYVAAEIIDNTGYKWCALVVQPPNAAVVVGDAERPPAVPQLTLRTPETTTFNGAAIYEIGQPGQPGFGMAAVPPDDLPLGTIPSEGGVYSPSLAGYGNYQFAPSAGFNDGAGLGVALAHSQQAFGSISRLFPSSLLFNAATGSVAVVGGNSRLAPLTQPPQVQPSALAAELVPGATIIDSNGQTWRSQRLGGSQVYGWIKAQSTAFDAELESTSLEIGTAGDPGFGMGCCAIASHPFDVTPLAPNWFVRTSDEFGNYVFPSADGDVGLLSWSVQMLAERVTGGTAARYRVGSVAIHPDTGVMWSVAPAGVWVKTSTL